jgi:hypothetical protein
MHDFSKKSDSWLCRKYNAIISKWHRSGGTSFGLDWPTARINWPEDYAVIEALREEAKRRKEARSATVSV